MLSGLHFWRILSYLDFIFCVVLKYEAGKHRIELGQTSKNLSSDAKTRHHNIKNKYFKVSLN